MLPASGGNLSGGCNPAGSSSYDVISSGILLEHDFLKIHFIGWSPNPHVRLSKILYINNNDFHNLTMSQMCAGACYVFRTSKPHSGTLCPASQGCPLIRHGDNAPYPPKIIIRVVSIIKIFCIILSFKKY